MTLIFKTRGSRAFSVSVENNVKISTKADETLVAVLDLREPTKSSFRELQLCSSQLDRTTMMKIEPQRAMESFTLTNHSKFKSSTIEKVAIRKIRLKTCTETKKG